MTHSKGRALHLGDNYIFVYVTQEKSFALLPACLCHFSGDWHTKLNETFFHLSAGPDFCTKKGKQSSGII